MFWRRLSFCFFALLTFAIPIEHKYDKLFRFFSIKLVPATVHLPIFFDKKIYFYASDLIALTLGMIALFIFRVPCRRFFASRDTRCLWIIFLLSILSIAWSPLAHYPILYIRLLQLATPFLLFSFLSNAYETKDIPNISYVIFGSLAIASLFQAVLAIVQYYYQSSLGLRFFGEPSHFSTLMIPGGEKWIFDSPIDQAGKVISIIRSSGTLPHANVLGGFLSVSMLASYSFFFIPRLRILAACAIPLQFFAMSLSFSRAALFSWCIATVIWFGFYFLKGSGRINASIRLLFLSLLLAISFSAVVLHKPIIGRGGIVNYNDQARSSDKGRLYYQDISFSLIKDHPLTGVGFQQFSIEGLKYTCKNNTYGQASGVHNIYLYLAAETGLISLAAFLFFIGNLFWTIRKLSFSPKLGSLLAIFIALLCIGCCDFYPILFQQGKLLLFIFAGLLSAQVRLAQIASSQCNEHAERDLKIGKKPIFERRSIYKMFDRLSTNYDQVNRVLSFGMDRNWRHYAALHLPQKKDLVLLDLASGTGDQLIACFESSAQIASAVGIDLSSEMLAIAAKKIASKSYRDQVHLQRVDAQNLSFPNASFDAATFSFGIRNVSDPLLSLQEIYRVLKPEGKCLILEFSLPKEPLKTAHLFYLRYLLPSIGGLLSKNKTAYQYLNQTIESFPYGKAFCSLMKQAGFCRVKSISMAFGAVSLYVGSKE